MDRHTTVIIRENSFLAKVAGWVLHAKNGIAITFGNTIHLHNVSKDIFLSNTKWVNHELQHVFQFQKYGLIRFSILYIWESLKNGYYNNKWEIEARGAENKIRKSNSVTFY